MGGDDNGDHMRFQPRGESVMNCPSSGVNTIPMYEKVGVERLSSMPMFKSSTGGDSFFGSGRDPLISLSQGENIGGSSMVSHREFANSNYPVVMENHGISSTPHIAHYPSSHANLVELVPKLSCFGSGSFSEMVGSFGLQECGQTTITGCPQNYPSNKEGGIEKTSTNGARSQEDCPISEEGASPNGKKRKRVIDSHSPFHPNVNSDGEQLMELSEGSTEFLKNQDEKKQKLEKNTGANLRGKQTGKQTKDDSQSGEAPNENYIHVRARRDQATNSHSLAERVRIEKVSERMRMLQELVPGCNKGKDFWNMNIIMGGGEKFDTSKYMVDRISQLPTSILQDILFFLPNKDAARTCILSKSWNQQVWSSLPVVSFDFNQHPFFEEKRVLLGIEEEEERQDAFINMVESSLQRLHGERFKILKFKLHTTRFDSKIAYFIDRWIQLAANNCVHELCLIIHTGNSQSIWYNFPKISFASAVGSLKILNLRGCKLQRNSLFDEDDNSMSLSLEKLILGNVVVDSEGGQDEIMQNLISRCPLIEDLRITKCWGVKFLQLFNHPKLKEIRVNVRHKIRGLDIFEKIEVDSLNLQTLICIGVYKKPLVVHATRCRNLRELRIKVARIEEDDFQNLVSSFPFLETLVLIRCKGLTKVKILSHPSLKNLRLGFNDLVELAVIDTPSLLTFKFGNYSIPTTLFFINAASSSLIGVSTHFLRLNYHLNTLWFIKLRDYLKQFNKHSLTLSLELTSRTYEFNVDELMRGISTFDLPYDVEHLKLNNLRSSQSYAALIDGLLWSCHPKRLSVKSNLKSNNAFMKFLCEILIEREVVPACCNSSHIKCWRHYLKDVMIDGGVGGTKTALLDSLLPTLATCEEVVFILSWL